ncbi:MAG: 50S ribosomal protein L4 [Alphaproteobacteria bacterium]|nr:50S ribosomal protein L4 [Alphaproteobacteria bacterium]MCB9974501.1 50S ribosomal protein L4 [Rhodospirillales bacterium]
MKLEVKNLENKKVGEITLDESVFGVEVRQDILHRMVNYQLAKRRSGTHKVKGRAEIVGTGAKPWRQKGTGRARAGDLKRPQDRGGGVVFGPHVRSHAFDLPKKIRKMALKIALSAKAAEGKIVILDEAKAKEHKTKPMAAALSKLGLDSAVIIGGSEIDANFARATANIPRIDVLTTQGTNVYDILRRDTLVLTKEAVNDLTEKLKSA